jgi:hypothetical protein
MDLTIEEGSNHPHPGSLLVGVLDAHLSDHVPMELLVSTQTTDRLPVLKSLTSLAGSGVEFMFDVLVQNCRRTISCDLTGEGGSICGGRWNPKGLPIIFTAESVALAVLEVLVRIFTPKYFSRVIDAIPATATQETILVADLPANWLLPHPNTHPIDIGMRWAMEKRTFLLKIFSAVVLGRMELPRELPLP